MVGSTFVMLFSYRRALEYKAGLGQYKIGMAISSDLVEWNRCDDDMQFRREGQEWMSESVSYPSIISVGKKLHLLFQGNGMGESGFGLADLQVIE